MEPSVEAWKDRKATNINVVEVLLWDKRGKLVTAESMEHIDPKLDFDYLHSSVFVYWMISEAGESTKHVLVAPSGKVSVKSLNVPVSPSAFLFSHCWTFSVFSFSFCVQRFFSWTEMKCLKERPLVSGFCRLLSLLPEFSLALKPVECNEMLTWRRFASHFFFLLLMQ